ncbi:MAG TPA: DUF3054 domain-containing protein [Pseudonocardiaceae bacterium]
MNRPRAAPTGRALGVGLAADVLAVLVFAAIGRRSHAEGSDLLALLATAGPFLVGLAGGWALARAWRAPLALRTGLLVWPVTVIVGLAVRTGFTGRLPVSFVLVVVLSLGVLLLGWRAVARLLTTRGSTRGRAGDAGDA